MSNETEVKISYEPIPFKEEQPHSDSSNFSPRGQKDNNFDDIHVKFFNFLKFFRLFHPLKDIIDQLQD